MNDMIGLKEPLQLSEGKVVQGHTALKDKQIQEKCGDQFVLVDAMVPNEIEIALSYGFKKVISLLELLTLYPKASPVGLVDFLMSEEIFKQIH